MNDNLNFENQFTPTEQLGGDLANLAMGWMELGIDPDDFLKCAVCHKFFRDLVEDLPDPPGEDELCACPDEPPEDEAG